MKRQNDFIIKPGDLQLHGLRTEDIYFSYPALNKSKLVEYKRSADKSLQEIKRLWETRKQGVGRHLLMGHAFEALLLEPGYYKQKFYVTMFEQWRGREGFLKTVNPKEKRGSRARFLKFLRQRGVEPLKKSEHERFVKMRDNLLQVLLPPLKKFGIRNVKDLLDRDFETQVIKVFQKEGVACKVLADVYLELPDGKLFICDIKTSRSICDINTFFFDALKYNYHFQAALYLNAFQAENVLPYFPFLVANTTQPVVNAYHFTSFFLKKVEVEILELIYLHKAMLKI